MIWEEVEKQYGNETADKMRNSKYLRGITIELTEDGKIDIPEGDIRLAYKDVMNIPIHFFEWD